MCLDDGVASLVNLDDVVRLHDGSHVAVLCGCLGEGEEAVEFRHECGVLLQLLYELLDVLHGFEVESCFEGENLVLGTENLLLILLQLLRDVAFAVDEGLLAHPFWWYGILERVAHFEVVSEDVVVADFERHDARSLYLALL